MKHFRFQNHQSHRKIKVISFHRMRNSAAAAVALFGVGVTAFSEDIRMTHGILPTLSEEQIKTTSWQDDYAWARELGFSVFDNTELVDDPDITRHIDGSACCAMRTNPDKINIAGCAKRCLAEGEACASWTWQPSDGNCWLLGSVQGGNALDIERKQAIDRTAGVRGLLAQSLTTTTPGPMIGHVMFRSARDLGLILNQAGPASGVILGVGTGERAIDILETWRGSILYLVDPYIHIWKGYDSVENVSDREHQMRFERLRNFFENNKRFLGRYSFAREFSFSFARIWREKGWEPKHSFLFVDGNPIDSAVEFDKKIFQHCFFTKFYDTVLNFEFFV